MTATIRASMDVFKLENLREEEEDETERDEHFLRQTESYFNLKHQLPKLKYNSDFIHKN